MADYRRANVPGATWFFTVNCAERRGNRLLADHIDALRLAFRRVKAEARVLSSAKRGSARVNEKMSRESLLRMGHFSIKR